MIEHDSLIALSVSTEPPADLHDRGLSELHLRFLVTELVHHLLAAGRCIAYGGLLDDPAGQEQNFTRIMLDLVSGHRPDLPPDDRRLVNFVAATVWDAADAATRADYQQTVAHNQGRFQVEQCPPEPLHPMEATTPQVRDALALTSMREQMAAQCAARVVIGGALAAYRGRYPGVVEEALLTLGAQRALYVVGGFGGAGTALAAHLSGQQVPELTQQWHLQHVPAAHDLAPLLADTPYELQLDSDLAAVLPPGNWAALCNGLSDADNERLATTTDVDEVVALVLRGLQTVAPTTIEEAP
ncbi:MAG TPA: hypothetical protein PLS72_12545 [Ilumatobacteraceae bacterium]|nr:hypothetical protein [Ilumatobacteraceae bacterium]